MAIYYAIDSILLCFSRMKKTVDSSRNGAVVQQSLVSEQQSGPGTKRTSVSEPNEDKRIEDQRRWDKERPGKRVRLSCNQMVVNSMTWESLQEELENLKQANNMLTEQACSREKQLAEAADYIKQLQWEKSDAEAKQQKIQTLADRNCWKLQSDLSLCERKLHWHEQVRDWVSSSARDGMRGRVWPKWLRLRGHGIESSDSEESEG